MQKTTEDEEGVFLSGFPIKDFGNDGGRETLNGSITPKSLIPEWFYQESKLFKGEDIWIPD